MWQGWGAMLVGTMHQSPKLFLGRSSELFKTPKYLETTYTKQILLNEISYSGTRCFCCKLNTHTDTWRCACFPVCCLIFNYMNRAIVDCMFCSSLLFHGEFPLRKTAAFLVHKITRWPNTVVLTENGFLWVWHLYYGTHSSGCGITLLSFNILTTAPREVSSSTLGNSLK